MTWVPETQILNMPVDAAVDPDMTVAPEETSTCNGYQKEAAEFGVDPSCILSKTLYIRPSDGSDNENIKNVCDSDSSLSAVSVQSTQLLQKNAVISLISSDDENEATSPTQHHMPIQQPSPQPKPVRVPRRPPKSRYKMHVSLMKVMLNIE